MAEMTPRERIMAVSHKKRADKLPFFQQWTNCHTGWAERKCRNRGMALTWTRPPYVIKFHGVGITEEQKVVSGQTIFRRTYGTPAGSVFEEEKREAGVALWHGQTDGHATGGKAPKPIELPVAGPADEAQHVGLEGDPQAVIDRIWRAQESHQG